MYRLPSFLLLLLLPWLAGCGDGTNPSEDVTGHYHATTFILTRVGIPPDDVLAAGGSMILELTADGTAGGNVFVPQSLTDDPQDFELTLLGTWTRTGNTVHLVHDAGDSFLEAIDWAVGSNTLSGTLDDIDGSIEITLTKDQP